MLRNPKFYLLLILIIAASLRLFNLFNVPPGLYPDEAMNGNNALESLATGQFKVFYPENNGREGLFINIQALFLKIFKINEPWVLRLPSALFGILTVLAIYFLATELFNKKIGLLSSFLLATSFWHINFSRIGFRAIMAPFCLAWGLYFLLKSFHSLNPKHYSAKGDISSEARYNAKGDISSETRYALFTILAGLFYGLGFHSYIAYRATPLLILIILIYFLIRSVKENWQKRFWLITILFTAITIIVFLPLGIYFLKNPADFLGRTSQISIFSGTNPLKTLSINILKTLGMFNFAGDFNWRHNYAGRSELFWPVGILFIIGIILGITRLFKNNKPGSSKLGFIILFSLFIIAALPVVISSEGLPHALRAILMIPAVFIFTGVGGIWLYEIMKSQIRPKYSKTPSTISTSIPSYKEEILATACGSKNLESNSYNKEKILNIFMGLFLILLVAEAYTTYFILWGKNPEVAGAFAQELTKIGQELKNLPQTLPKYVIIEAGGVGMPAQTLMFLTDTFTPKKQNAKNLHYILPNQKDLIPQNTLVKEIK